MEDPGDTRIGDLLDLFKRMKVGQFWAVVVAAAAIVGLVFWAGWWTKTVLSVPVSESRGSWIQELHTDTFRIDDSAHIETVEAKKGKFVLIVALSHAPIANKLFLSVPALLAEAYGENDGEAIFSEGTACIETAETELSVLRPDLSNQ